MSDGEISNFHGGGIKRLGDGISTAMDSAVVIPSASQIRIADGVRFLA